MDAKKLLAELLNRGCIREGREMTAFQLIKFEIEAASEPGTTVIQHGGDLPGVLIGIAVPVSAEDLDAVADEAKAGTILEGFMFLDERPQENQ